MRSPSLGFGSSPTWHYRNAGERRIPDDIRDQGTRWDNRSAKFEDRAREHSFLLPCRMRVRQKPFRSRSRQSDDPGSDSITNDGSSWVLLSFVFFSSFLNAERTRKRVRSAAQLTTTSVVYRSSIILPTVVTVILMFDQRETKKLGCASQKLHTN